MSSQDSMFLPSLAGRAAPWDISSAHSGAEDRVSSVTRCVDTGNKPTISPSVTTDVTVCYKCVWPCCPGSCSSPLWAIFSISHFWLWWLRLCNHLMGCCAAVSFPKVSNNISAGSFKFYAEISKWPTKMTSFVFRKYSVHILALEQFWGTHFALRAWLSHKLSVTKCHSVLLVNYGFWKRWGA